MELEYKNFEAELKTEISVPGFFTGYASTFGGKADFGGDIIHEGAFKETLKSGGIMGFGIAMCWMHDTKQPLGTWTKLVEDAKGLAVEGQLAIATQIGHDAYEFMKMGAIKGLSIGYKIPEGGSEYDEKKKERHLKKIQLYEISPVTLPMNNRAIITNIKSAQSERELEDALRDEGLSRPVAKYIAGLCKLVLFERKNKTSVAGSLRDASAAIKSMKSLSAVQADGILTALRDANATIQSKDFLDTLKTINKQLLT